MKRYSFYRTSASLLLLVFLLLLLPVLPIFGHEGEGYSFETTLPISNPRWMTALPDDLHVSDLSIPGTHDTMAYKVADRSLCTDHDIAVPGSLAWLLAQTQSMNLAEQLRVGVRVLDIRGRIVKKEGEASDPLFTSGDYVFAIHHSCIFLDAYFGPDVLGPAIEFLLRNPGEVLFMKVSEAGTSDLHDAPPTIDFKDVFNDYWETTLKRYPGIFWENTADPNPGLADLRGRIVIIQKNGLQGKPDFGLEFKDFVVNDKEGCSETLRSRDELYRKWRCFRDHILEAGTVGSPERIYRTSLVGSAAKDPDIEGATIFPWWVASGHLIPTTDSPRERTLFRDPPLRDDDPTYPDFPRVDCDLGDVGSACLEGCQTAGDGCRSVCTTTANACRTPCRIEGDVCRALCPPGPLGKKCRDRCNQRQRNCERPCDNAESSCKEGCRTAQEVCEEPCDVLEGCAIAYEGINELTLSFMRSGVLTRRVGIIDMDFPGPGLIEAIIDLNFHAPFPLPDADMPPSPPSPCSNGEPGDEKCVPFRRGDSNVDGRVDISDSVFLLEALFGGGAEGECPAASDVNDDGTLNVSDAIFLLGFVFLGEAAPAEPFPACGLDPTPDDLGCESFTVCE